MKTVSTELFNAIHKRNRQFSLLLDFGDFEITKSENYSQEVISSPSSGLTFGTVAIGTGSFELKKNTVDVVGKTFRAFLGVKVGNEFEHVKLGKFTVTDVQAKGIKTEVLFEDDIARLDKTFDRDLTIPATAVNILNTVGSICGVTFDLSNVPTDLTIQKPVKGFVCREIVGWIAQLLGTFVAINATTEKICFKWYEDTGYIISKDNYLYMIREPITDSLFELGALSCNTGTETLTATVDNTRGIVSMSNPFMTQTSLEALLEQRKGFSYNGGELPFVLGNPLLDVWDIVTVEYAGKTSAFPCMSLSFTFSGAVTGEAKSFVRNENTAFEGKITKELNNVRTQVTVLDGKVESKVSATVFEETTAETKKYIDDATGDLQNQIDGNITTWTGQEIPTLSNEPAVNWIDEATKNQHIGDLYYVESDSDAQGFCYRFQQNQGNYEWVLLKDNEITEAIQKANEAKNKADSVGDDLAKNYSTTTEVNSAISQKVDEISLSVSKTYTTKDEAERLVGKDEVINSINVSIEGVKISGDKIDIEGQVTFSSLNDEVKTAIDDARENAEAAKNAVDNIEVGGRNLITKSRFDPSNVYQSSVAPVYQNNGIYISGAITYLYYGITLHEGLVIGETYTFSCCAATSANANYRWFRLGNVKNVDGNNQYYAGIIPNDTAEHTITVTFTATSAILTLSLYPYASRTIPSSASWMYAYDIKLEKGTMATDYTPAVEDVDANIAKAQTSANDANKVLADWCYENNKTVIDGGKLAAGTVTAKQINVADLFAQNIKMDGAFTATVETYIPPDEEIAEKIKKHIFREELIPDAEIPLYDFLANGAINSTDMYRCRQCINGEATLDQVHDNAVKSTVTITINPSNPDKAISFSGVDMWGRDVSITVGSNGVVARRVKSHTVAATYITATNDDGTGLIETDTLNTGDANVSGHLNVNGSADIQLLNAFVAQISAIDENTEGVLQISYLDGSVLDLVPLVKGLTGNVQEQLNAMATEIQSKTSLYGMTDNRSVATIPNNYNGKFCVAGLKLTSAIGYPSSDSLSGVIGFRQWKDSTGGNAHELAFNNSGLFMRSGETTSWGSWEKFITSATIGSQSVNYATSANTATKAGTLSNYYNANSRPTSANFPVVGDGSIKTFMATSSMTEGKPMSDGHIIHSEWDNGDGYSVQLYIPNVHGEYSMQYRQMAAGAWGNWRTLWDKPVVLFDGNASNQLIQGQSVSINMSAYRSIRVYYHMPGSAGVKEMHMMYKTGMSEYPDYYYDGVLAPTPDNVGTGSRIMSMLWSINEAKTTFTVRRCGWFDSPSSTWNERANADYAVIRIEGVI